MSDESRTGRASFSGPEALIEQAKTYADENGLSFSRFVCLSMEFAMITDGVEPERGNYWERREEIKDRNRFAQNKAFFLDRVDDRLTELFKSRAKPKEIIDVARGYLDEANEIETESREREDVADYADGEIEREVKHLVRETLEAQNLTNWDKRYTNRLERFDGVEDGLERRKFALVLAQNAMHKDLDLEPLRSLADSERRVRGDDLPDLADEHLPMDLDRDDVADAARRLVDRDLDPDDLPTDPHEFTDRFGGATFGWNEMGDPEAALDGDADPENAAAPIAADGGDLDTPDLVEHDQDDSDDQDEPDERDVGDLIEWAEEQLRLRSQANGTSFGNDPLSRGQTEQRAKEKARKNAEQHVEQKLNNTATWQHEIMNAESLTSDDVIEAADNYHEQLWNGLEGNTPDPAAAIGGEQA